MAESRTGAQWTVKALEAQGVEYVFGIPGVQNLELFDAFREASFQAVLVTHELAGSFMADACGRLTGRPGCLVTIPGPGLTNAMTGLAEALLDSSPVVAIIPSARSDTERSFQLHQIPQAEAARPLVKAVVQVSKAEEIPAKIAEAFALACAGDPGPVLLDVPYNVFWERGRAEVKVEGARPYGSEGWTMGQAAVPAGMPVPTAPGLAPQDLRRIADLLGRARRLGLYAGVGATDAVQELRELAELLQAPVATTLAGRGLLPEDHPLAAGFGFGACGTPWAEEVFGQCDTVLAVGCKFSEVSTGVYGMTAPPHLVHLDINPGVLNKNMPAEIACCADARVALRQLLVALRGAVRPRNTALEERLRSARQAYFGSIEQEPAWDDAVNPAKLLWTLRRATPRDVLVTTDSGAHQFWAAACFPVYEPRSYLTPTDYQSMGFGIPAMVAAALLFPKRKAIGLVGDGGFQMTGMEMLTARRLGLAPLAVVFNDGALGLIEEAQRRIYRRRSCVELLNPDFEALAEALGAQYFLIRNDHEIAPALEAALGATKMALVDARVRYHEHTRYFQGAAAANFQHMPFALRLRFAARALQRMLWS